MCSKQEFRRLMTRWDHHTNSNLQQKRFTASLQSTSHIRVSVKRYNTASACERLYNRETVWNTFEWIYLNCNEFFVIIEQNM